jgi:hypothetical protein
MAGLVCLRNPSIWSNERFSSIRTTNRAIGVGIGGYLARGLAPWIGANIRLLRSRNRGIQGPVGSDASRELTCRPHWHGQLSRIATRLPGLITAMRLCFLASGSPIIGQCNSDVKGSHRLLPDQPRLWLAEWSMRSAAKSASIETVKSAIRPELRRILI